MAGLSTTRVSLGRPTGRCAATGRELVPGERIYAALVEPPGDADLTRIDAANDAWAAGWRPDAKLGRLFAAWRTTYEPGESRKARPAADDAWGLFEELGEEDHAEGEGVQVARFALALLLVRWRQAELLRRTPTGGLVLRRRGGGGGGGVDLPPEERPEHTVEAPAVTPERLESALRQLANLSGGMLDES